MPHLGRINTIHHRRFFMPSFPRELNLASLTIQISEIKDLTALQKTPIDIVYRFRLLKKGKK